MRSISARCFHNWDPALAQAAVCPLPALAQEGRGQFTIPRTVHFPRIPAGSFSYSIGHHASEVSWLRPKSGGSGHFLLATFVSRSERPVPNELTLEQRGVPTWYVTSVVVNSLGEVLIFPGPPAANIVDSGPKLATIASNELSKTLREGTGGSSCASFHPETSEWRSVPHERSTQLAKTQTRHPEDHC